MAPGRGVPALAAELLAGLTRPTLVALDDVDDASSATRELLGAVARLHGAGHERVLFVLTRELPRREGGGGEALAAVLARFCEVEVVRLSPLSAGAVERALGRLSTGHAISSSLVAEVTRRSQGEPALLTGALSALLPVSPLVTGTAFPADAEGLLDVVSAETLNQARVHELLPTPWRWRSSWRWRGTSRGMSYCAAQRRLGSRRLRWIAALNTHCLPTGPGGWCVPPAPRRF